MVKAGSLKKQDQKEVLFHTAHNEIMWCWGDTKNELIKNK